MIQASLACQPRSRRPPTKRLAQARVIAGTCAGVQGDPQVGELRFAVAILEEAGKATPPEALMIALRSQKSILVCDNPPAAAHLWDPTRTPVKACAATEPQPHRTDPGPEIDVLPT